MEGAKGQNCKLKGAKAVHWDNNNIIIKYKVESTVVIGKLVIIAILFQFLVHVCIRQ